MTVPNPQDLQGQLLLDADGEEIGRIEGVYLDNSTRRPEWAAVRLGPSGPRSGRPGPSGPLSGRPGPSGPLSGGPGHDGLALVPLADAVPNRAGARVPFGVQDVLEAPFRLRALDNEVTEETERLLYEYYAGGAGDAAGVVTGAAADVAATAREQAAGVTGIAAEEASEVVAAATSRAGEVVDVAREEAAVVAEVAREEAADVAAAVAAEARDLAETTRSEIELQAETQIEQVAESLHRLAGQALALARGNAGQAGPLGELVGRAGEELQAVAAGIDERGSAGMLGDARRVVRQRPRTAIIGTAVAVVAGARLMGTPAGGRLKAHLGPLKDQALDAGRSVAEELRPSAQERAERVKAAAEGAVAEVTAGAEEAADDVKATAKRSARAVKGTAARSASAVKGEASRSASAAKATTKRSARAATGTAARPAPAPGTARRRAPAR